MQLRRKLVGERHVEVLFPPDERPVGPAEKARRGSVRQQNSHRGELLDRFGVEFFVIIHNRQIFEARTVDEPLRELPVGMQVESIRGALARVVHDAPAELAERHRER